MRMMQSHWWPGRRRPTAGMKVMKERSRNRSAVGAGQNFGSTARNWATWKGAVHISPQGQVRGKSGTAEEMGHRVVSGEAISTGGVIYPAYGVTVGLKP